MVCNNVSTSSIPIPTFNQVSIPTTTQKNTFVKVTSKFYVAKTNPHFLSSPYSIFQQHSTQLTTHSFMKHSPLLNFCYTTLLVFHRSCYAVPLMLAPPPLSDHLSKMLLRAQTRAPFSQYILSLGDPNHSHGTKHHLWAEDNQISISSQTFYSEERFTNPAPTIILHFSTF